jgi:peptidoglycan LD-endopeptidase CwlK
MFTLGQRSLEELKGVHPRLVAVVKRALELTPQDFAVHDGLRTETEQAMLVHKGASWTMNSKHLKQADGYGHAVDLVPYINGKLRWEWPAIYPIAEAMREAATELGVRLRWGGHWAELTATAAPPSMLVRKYVDERRRAKQEARIDGPHYELIA